jgi:uroporphyrin-III C-methyltransferase
MGEVVLVGAGPGDPELLTLRALKLIQSADVIVYDSLISREILAFAQPLCRLCFVGKRKNRHSASQAQISQLLINYTHDNDLVVRLKGGDPLIFGRASEELDALNEAQIPWSIVPGITAVAGAAASYAIPLTKRQEFFGVSYITAHRSHGNLEVDWQVLLQPNQTVVVYMGVTLLEEIVAGLLRLGKHPETTFTIVSRATTAQERVIESTLGRIMQAVRDQSIETPAVMIMGPASMKRTVGLTDVAKPHLSNCS